MLFLIRTNGTRDAFERARNERQQIVRMFCDVGVMVTLWCSTPGNCVQTNNCVYLYVYENPTSVDCHTTLFDNPYFTPFVG